MLYHCLQKANILISFSFIQITISLCSSKYSLLPLFASSSICCGSQSNWFPAKTWKTLSNRDPRDFLFLLVPSLLLSRSSKLSGCRSQSILQRVTSDTTVRFVALTIALPLWSLQTTKKQRPPLEIYTWSQFPSLYEAAVPGKQRGSQKENCSIMVVSLLFVFITVLLGSAAWSSFWVCCWV